MTSPNHEQGARRARTPGRAPVRRAVGSRRRLTPAGETAAVAALTRAAVLLAVVAAAYVSYRHGDQAAGLLRRLFVQPMTHKDAGWFVHIAREGYGGSPGRPAFFPLYPLLVRAASVLTFGDYWVAGLVVSLLSYAGAMVLLFLVTVRETSRRAAFVTVTLISVFPTAFVFSAIYSESLFLLLSVATFFFALRRRWAVAAAMGFFATLTRSSGILLFAPLLLMLAEQQGWATRRPLRLRRDDLRAAWLLLVPAGLVTYMVYLWARFGDPLRFVEAQGLYWRRDAAWPWITVWRGAERLGRGVQTLAAHPLIFPDGLLPGGRWEVVLVRTVLPFAALVFAAVCLVIVLRKLPLPYGVYAALALLLPLMEPSAFAPLYSYHRFVLVVFPLFMGLGVVLEKRTRLFWALAAASFVLMLYLAVCFASAAPGARGVV